VRAFLPGELTRDFPGAYPNGTNGHTRRQPEPGAALDESLSPRASSSPKWIARHYETTDPVAKIAGYAAGISRAIATQSRITRGGRST
jgi:hypothetical protein